MRTELTSLVLVTVVMIGLFLNISLYSSVSVNVTTVVFVTRDDMMVTDGRDGPSWVSEVPKAHVEILFLCHL